MAHAAMLEGLVDGLQFFQVFLPHRLQQYFEVVLLFLELFVHSINLDHLAKAEERTH